MKTLCVPALLAALALSGCASKYYDARFAPPTTEAIATSQSAEGGLARSIVSIVGVRKKDSESGAPPQVEFKLRLENLGSVPCNLQQHSLQLLSGRLEPFGAAQLTGEDPPVVAAGASANYTVLFPLPEGRDLDQVDLRSLNLRWAVAFDGEEVTNGVTFERIFAHHDEPSRFSVGIGFWGH